MRHSEPTKHCKGCAWFHSPSGSSTVGTNEMLESRCEATGFPSVISIGVCKQSGLKKEKRK